eukprot:CAMPEP_0195510970 /NCGR_PEP_ID=MMETSP0794_2-20130614/3450_1 /TAXON_ID=515487 /ORGANISM="Stephanopyxis turris, Strain CCMP 815" /LENGTH=314 /DNA_ID=CAMNT_0040638497 /DNA_START=113 /DNA_END=1057 /DNA_ORIENTATION=-
MNESDADKRNSVNGITDDSQPERMSYCSRFFWEWKQPFFGLKEVPSGECIKVSAAFVARNRAATIFFRLCFFAWALSILVYNLVTYPSQNRFIYMGYLTHWALVLTCATFLATLACTIWKSSLDQPLQGEPAHAFVRLTWFLISLTIPLQAMVVLLYWTLDYKGQRVTYLNATRHGVLLVVLLFDGFVLGNIPIRIKQGLFSFIMAVLFSIWLTIHPHTGLGNGDWPNESDTNDDTNDDVLYSVVNWKDNPTPTAIVLIIVTFVVAPLMFFFLWTFSLASKCLKFDGSSRTLHRYNEEEASVKGSASELIDAAL